VLDGLENLKDLIEDKVVDLPGSYVDYYYVGAGVPLGLVSPIGQCDHFAFSPMYQFNFTQRLFPSRH